MALERRQRGGRYYYRARWANGRAVKEYVGAGPLAEAVAHLDAAAREGRRAQLEAVRAELAALEATGAEVADVGEAIDRLAAAVLLASGCHRHDRGAWRRRVAA